MNSCHYRSMTEETVPWKSKIHFENLVQLLFLQQFQYYFRCLRAFFACFLEIGQNMSINDNYEFVPDIRSIFDVNIAFGVDQYRSSIPWSQTPRGNKRNWNNQKSQQLGSDFVMYNKACFVCESFDLVQANRNYHQRERMVSGNNYTRVNYNYSAKKAHPRAHRNIVPRAGHPQKEDQGYVDSGCSRHMTGNMSYLSNFKEFDEGYVIFRGGAKGGRITSKGTLKTGKLDFKDVYFVKELEFNLFSVSQMCDKKNSVLFTDTGCFVLSPNFKLADES
ncbi:hypothetical protein Tco_0111976 [Tanacetum coccineum]